MHAFSTFCDSFYSLDLYRKARENSRYCFGYVLFVVAFLSFIIVVHSNYRLHRELFVARGDSPALFEDIVHQIANQFPVMSLKDGSFQTSEPGVHIIKISGSVFGTEFHQWPLITVDTSGHTTRENKTTPILISDKNVSYEPVGSALKGSSEAMATDYPAPPESFVTLTDRVTEYFKNLSENMPRTLIINRALIEDAAQNFIQEVRSSLPLFYCLLVGISWISVTIFFYVARVLLFMIFGFLGMIFGVLHNAPTSFRTAFHLSALSYTPIATLETSLIVLLGTPASQTILLCAGSVVLFAVIHLTQQQTPKNII